MHTWRGCIWKKKKAEKPGELVGETSIALTPLGRAAESGREEGWKHELLCYRAGVDSVGAKHFPGYLDSEGDRQTGYVWCWGCVSEGFWEPLWAG